MKVALITENKVFIGAVLWLAVYADYTKKVHRVMNGSKTQKFIKLWTNQKQTDDSALVQSKGTKMIYINSRRIILCCNLFIFDIH